MEPSSAPPPAPQTPLTAPEQTRAAVILSAAEFTWLTIAVWIGGIFILTLMPVLLIPRLGMMLGVGGSYLLFFMCWQPIQSVTQRTYGARAGVLRMIAFVAAGAIIAYYVREALFGGGQ